MLDGEGENRSPMDREAAFNLLGLDATATSAEAEFAYRRMARAWDGRINRAPSATLRVEYRSARDQVGRAIALIRGYAEPHVKPGPRATVGASVSIGRLLANRFEVRRRIGVGPAGAVFEAFDRAGGSVVAVKVFLPERIRGACATRALAKETEATAELNHPGIARTLGAHRDGDLRFVVREYVPGTTLRQRMDTLAVTGRPFSVSMIAGVAVALCAALAYAHRRTVHIDIKPENIVFREDGTVVLTDFSVACIVDGETAAVPGVPLRDTPYLAPERVRASENIDHRADQYAVAAVLYEMLTGDIPVGRSKSPTAHRPETPRPLSHALERALEPDPADRFPNMQAFAAALIDRPAQPMHTTRAWAIAALILVFAAAGATFPDWRTSAGLVIRKTLRDSEQQAAAESARLRALASESNWRRIADLLPPDQWPDDIVPADRALAEGDRFLKNIEFKRAGGSFRRAFDLYEANVAVARRWFREHPSRMAGSARKVRGRFDDLERALYERVSQSNLVVDASVRDLRAARTDDERRAIESRLGESRAELTLVERLLSLTQTHVLDESSRDQMATALEQADALLDVGRYRDALTAYAQIEVRLAELLDWARRAEESLREERALSRKVERFRSDLGPTALGLANGQEAIDTVANLAAEGEEKLAAGRVDEAIEIYRSGRTVVSQERKRVATDLLAIARARERSGRRTAAVRAINELEALDKTCVDARELRAVILADRLTNTIGMEFAFIPPGAFSMCSPSGETGRDEDERQTPVAIDRGFHLSTTEVTQAQWYTVMQNRPSYRRGDDRPVERVSWHDAVEFCRRISLAEGRVYRLPTETEWEYACRAGTTTPFAFGDTLNPGQANYDTAYSYRGGPTSEPRGETVSVGAFPANAWGLHDMHGNVWEWCADRAEPATPFATAGWTFARSAERRVLRGGSWRHRPRFCRSANRVYGDVDSRLDTIGFRVVLESE